VLSHRTGDLEQLTTKIPEGSTSAPSEPPAGLAV